MDPPPPVDDTRPLVSVVMPVMNEADHLPSALEHLQHQTYPPAATEISSSTADPATGTLELARRYAATDPRISVLGGPGVNCPAAMNMGILAARGDVVAKIDGHGHVDPWFIETAVDRLAADAWTGCVGGVNEPIGSGTIARANMIARFSVLGVGRGVYTSARNPHEVDTVQCGVYARHALEAAGGFDEELQFGEDEELNHRLRRAGFRILFEPRMRFSDVIRPTSKGLWRQYRAYGRARVKVVRKHPNFLRAKHAAPLALVSAAGISAVLPLARRPLWRVPAAPAGGYAALLAGGGAALSVRARFGHPWLVMASLACVHLGYGIGSLQGIADWARRR